MEKISLPTKIEIKEETLNSGLVIIEPCYPGYGLTVGNALRRVLLSSLPGAAVVAFKIKGVQHEFSTIAGVKEDVVEIMMNLKQLCLKVHCDEVVELVLKIKGEKEVKAGDIEKNSEVEIINPEFTICNITDKSGEIEMKIWVKRGLGYVPVEENKGEKPELGVIQVDAVYTPVLKVGITRENVRVGERTDYDKLTLNIETDGTISVKEAVKQAAGILVEQFSWLASFEERIEGKEGELEDGGEDGEEGGGETAALTEKEEIKVEAEEENKGEEREAEVKLKKRGRPKKVEKV